MPEIESTSQRRTYEEYIHKEYFSPYFLSGVKKYVERGDIIAIEDLELFVLNSSPENGFITKDTTISFEFGLTKQRCLEKINKADNQYASTLYAIEDGYSRSLLREDYRGLDLGMHPIHSRFGTTSLEFIFLKNHINNIKHIEIIRK